ncbi:MAG: hypothetical protein JXR96_05660 [Deltaproteobacteria bacterium]|nr:hypothetical protein [Deltaproteobacteria bacterium]
MRKPILLGVTAGLLLCSGLAAAQPSRNVRPQQKQAAFSADNADFAMGLDEQAQAAEQARTVSSEANFDAIIMPQNKMAFPAAAPVDVPNQMGWGGQAARRAQRQAPITGGTQTIALSPEPAEPEIELPLADFVGLRERIQEIRKRAARLQGPAVVLGASEYRGQAIQGALQLRLELQVTLGRPETWKTVPIAGDDVVLVRAQVEGQPIPVSRRNGFHVWVTRRTGELTVDADILVPSRGPRGSIEYDFLVARTPVTRFECRFPVADLEPRMNAAVQSEAVPVEGGTIFKATLRPTTHIHLLGLKDMGQAEGQAAKVYAESLNLLSVEEGALELFSVIRYNILYAGTKEFQIRIPAKMKVVSAEGMGAFHYELEPGEGGWQLLRGETAFPIRNNYEISLRLRREMKRDREQDRFKPERISAPLPRCLGVERDAGWLGVEVPGKMQLEAVEPKPIDVRFLPEEMVRSAVSPILKAYRYQSPEAPISLEVTRLPEIEPASDSIDRVRAFTKVTPEGNALTDMRITLRNRLLQNLSLKLAPGSTIKSALLDGQPFIASRDAEGRVLVTLKRSSGGERLEPFTISLIIEGECGAMGWLGHPGLSLPAVDLPVSSMAWTVYVPARNIYTRLEGEWENQRYVGQATWHQAGYREESYGQEGQLEASPVRPAEPAAAADAGAMPVRFKVPKDGIQLDYTRYWVGAEQPVEVSFWYLRSWLRIPAWLLLAALLAAGLLVFSLRFRALPSRSVHWLGAALAVAAAVGAYEIGGLSAVVLGVLGGLIAVAVQRRWFRRAPEQLGEWAGSLVERFRKRPRDEAGSLSALMDVRPGKQVPGAGFLLTWKILISIGLIFFGLLLVGALGELVFLLFHPL